MTQEEREKQISEEAYRIYPKEWDGDDRFAGLRVAFMRGAHWADKNSGEQNKDLIRNH